MIGLVELWHTYGGVAQGAFGLVGGWYGRVVATAATVRRDRLDAGQQALNLAAALAAREREQASAVAALRRREWALADSVQDVYAEAIAARLIVHDLDATAGRPLRQFRPLPPYPFPAEPSEPVSDPASDAA